MDESAVARGIRSVIFDVDGTLYRSAPVRRAMLVRLLANVALHPRRGLRTISHLRAYRHAQEELRGVPALVDLDARQIEHACRASGATPSEMRACVDEWMNRRPLDLVRAAAMPGLDDALRQLRSAGLRLGVFSDYPAGEKLRALRVADLFDAVACAQDEGIGRFKPDPLGLDVVAGLLGTAPARTLYVGDRLDVDAAAALRGGFRFLLLGRSDRERDGIREVASLARIPAIVRDWR